MKNNKIYMPSSKNIKKKGIVNKIKKAFTLLKEYWGIDDWIGLSVLILGFLYFFLPIPLYANETFWEIYQDIHAEMIGIGITVLILGNADEAIRKKIEKNQLIDQLRSPDNGFALEALRKISEEGWINDGSLLLKEFPSANLKESKIVQASLGEVNFRNAIFEKSLIIDGDFNNAKFVNANLNQAFIVGTDFRGANFGGATLRDTKLINNKLEGASFIGAHLEGANLEASTFDENTLWLGLSFDDKTKWPKGFDLNLIGDVDPFVIGLGEDTPAMIRKHLKEMLEFGRDWYDKSG